MSTVSRYALALEPEEMDLTPAPEPAQDPESYPGYSLEYDRDWTWVTFPTKPAPAVLETLKGSGARWSARRAAWFFTRRVEESELVTILATAPSAPQGTTPAPEPVMSEADKARAWLASLDFENMQKDDTFHAEFWKYELSLYRGENVFYLSTRSPQQKQHRWSHDTQARGDKESVFAGLERFIQKMEEKAARRDAKTQAKRAARAAFVNPYRVGDFLNSSWGYDQTNKEFYQVVEVKAMSLVIREVAQDREQTGYDSGTCAPRRNEFIGPEKTVIIQVDERGGHWVNSPLYGGLYKWDGKPEYWSSGH